MKCEQCINFIACISYCEFIESQVFLCMPIQKMSFIDGGLIRRTQCATYIAEHGILMVSHISKLPQAHRYVP